MQSDTHHGRSDHLIPPIFPRFQTVLLVLADITLKYSLKFALADTRQTIRGLPARRLDASDVGQRSNGVKLVLLCCFIMSEENANVSTNLIRAIYGSAEDS